MQVNRAFHGIEKSRVIKINNIQRIHAVVEEENLVILF